MTLYRCTECGREAQLEGFLENESPACTCGGDMDPAWMF